MANKSFLQTCLNNRFSMLAIVTGITLILFSCSSVETQSTDSVSQKTSSGKIDRSVRSEAAPKVATQKKIIKKNKKDVAPDAVALADNQAWEWPTETEAELKPHAEAVTLDLNRPLVKSFVKKMVIEHGFDKAYIEATLAQSTNKPSILKIMSRPAEKSKEWFEYRPIFLTDKRINSGKTFMEENAITLQAAESKYGVPKEIISAIIGVETYYGRNSGKYKVLDSLVTLGFNYPPRAKFFRRELEQFFLLSREEGFAKTEVLGSYAGAMGNGQFISSSYRNFTADGDGDGKRDLWNSWPDAIHSVANYFHKHKWKKGEDVLAKAMIKTDCSAKLPLRPESKVEIKAHTIGSLRDFGCGIDFKTSLNNEAPAMFLEMQQENSTDYLIGFSNFYTITRYNRSPMYARAVYQLSQELASP